MEKITLSLLLKLSPVFSTKYGAHGAPYELSLYTTTVTFPGDCIGLRIYYSPDTRLISIFAVGLRQS